MLSTRLRRQFIKFSIKEVFFWQFQAVTVAPGSIYFLGLLLMLNATDFHFTLLTVILQSVAVIQVFSAIILKKTKSIKKFTLLNYGASKFILPLIIVIMLFAPEDAKLTLIFVVVIAYAITVGMGANAHNSWIQDRVPKHFLGRFFAYRDFSVRIVVLTFGFACAIFYDLFGDLNQGFNQIIRGVIDVPEFFNPNNREFALIILFSIGCIAGFISLYFLIRHPESSFKLINTQKIGVYLKEPFKDKNFRRIFIFLFYWNFAASIGSPFWGPFMLRELDMSFFNIQIYSALSTIGGVLIIKRIGLLVDKIGYVKILKFAIVLSFINPIFFVICVPGTWWLLLFEAVGSGVCWGIIAVASFNMMIVNSPKDKKEIYLAFFAIAPGLGAVLASSLSYPILEMLKMFEFGFNPIRIIFAFVALTRISTLIPLKLLIERKQSIK